VFAGFFELEATPGIEPSEHAPIVVEIDPNDATRINITLPKPIRAI
jgi:hypothetical protein